MDQGRGTPPKYVPSLLLNARSLGVSGCQCVGSWSAFRLWSRGVDKAQGLPNRAYSNDFEVSATIFGKVFFVFGKLEGTGRAFVFRVPV